MKRPHKAYARTAQICGYLSRLSCLCGRFGAVRPCSLFSSYEEKTEDIFLAHTAAPPALERPSDTVQATVPTPWAISLVWGQAQTYPCLDRRVELTEIASSAAPLSFRPNALSRRS